MTSSSRTDATATASRTFCADYARLQGDLAAAKDASVLDEKIGELTGKLALMPAVRAANLQAEVIARLLHLTSEDAEAWYALLFALAVEAATMSVLLIAESVAYRRPLGHIADGMVKKQSSLPQSCGGESRKLSWRADARPCSARRRFYRDEPRGPTRGL
jgi:hypothetical protein